MLAPGSGATYNSNRVTRRLSEVNPYNVVTGGGPTPYETLVIIFVLVNFLKSVHGATIWLVTDLTRPQVFHNHYITLVVLGFTRSLFWVSNSSRIAVAIDQPTGIALLGKENHPNQWACIITMLGRRRTATC